MVQSLLIGKKIKSILSNNSELYEQVKGQIYPLLANQNTKYPFIVYSRDNVEAKYCKDGNFQDDVAVTFVIVSDNYEESVEVANKVRKTFESLEYEDDDIYIADSFLIGVQENTQEDAYVQKLTLKFNIN